MSSITRSVQAGPAGPQGSAGSPRRRAAAAAAARLGAPAAARPRRGGGGRAHARRRVGTVVPPARDHRRCSSTASQLPRLARPFAEQIAEATRRDRQRQRAQRHGRRLHRQGARQRGHAARPAHRLARAAPLRRRRQGHARLHERGRPASRCSTRPLTALTANTITDPGLLRASSPASAQRGYSIDNQEVVMGVYCVVGADPRPQAAARSARSASPAPRRRSPGPEIEPMVAMLREACGHVSRRLGYQPATGRRAKVRKLRSQYCRSAGRQQTSECRKASVKKDAQCVGDEAEARQRGDLQAEARRDLARDAGADASATASATTRSTATA